MSNKELISAIRNKKDTSGMTFNEFLYVMEGIQKKEIDITANDNEAMKLACKLNDLFWIRKLHAFGAKIGAEELKILFEANSKRSEFKEESLLFAIEKIDSISNKIAIELIKKLPANHDSKAIINMLIEKGFVIEKNMMELLGICSSNGYPNLLNMLFNIGIDVTVFDNYAIKTASKNGHYRVVNYLLGAGADATVNDNEPIKVAFENEHYSVVRLLYAKGAKFEKEEVDIDDSDSDEEFINKCYDFVCYEDEFEKKCNKLLKEIIKGFMFVSSDIKLIEQLLNYGAKLDKEEYKKAFKTIKRSKYLIEKKESRKTIFRLLNPINYFI